ncbi:GMC family oxidoreductase [Kitasatospora cathayae]|uniref:GMC family oxidoreductase N-terminal domain-containing protein n=1 Tax=Kitasatospora cathayae TaxID=3004092 RepID=A0ABY7PYX0_9ACTN|nr:GMC family oxidoreductase N-terminal domain-containing protein [Kitasatospora sp. HUAS 3-15]WBP85146.1 GMC family oxidoreductase N-terminal domain-containing protein [Kitasatospora sp. HUAS 3-15]
MREEFDYVVVGAGTAGSVLAHRLTEDRDVRVLVLEAGAGRIPTEVDDPTAWMRLLGSRIDWGYRSTPQPGLDGRVTREPRGRAPGGSSNLNLMMHVRGHPADFDHWAYRGAAGWSYRDVRPYFDRMEADRPLTHAGLGTANPASRAFVDACAELGHPQLADFADGPRHGVAWHRLDIAAGRRRGALAGYLEPALGRPNLTLRSDAQALRLVLAGGRCVGVEYLQRPESAGLDGRAVRDVHGEVLRVGIHQAFATAEVILAAGAIESPKLLLLSGVGNPDHLRQLGITVNAALPGVGENFHNHVLTAVMSESRTPVPAARQNLSEAALFLASEPGLIAPDLQLAFVHVPFDSALGREHPDTVSVLPGVVRPASRGWVRLGRADALARPLVNPNYLGDRSDLERLVQGVKQAREVIGTSAFSPWHKQELWPGPDVRDAEQLRAFVRRTADSYHHHAGSCRMGTDDLSVVDPRLRVHGVSGLRVADAGVMPALPSANPHAAVVMIAERAADLIREGTHG